MLYDLANSGYTTVVLTTIFNAYFVAVVANAYTSGVATFLWTATIAAGNVLVILSAPVLGAIADRSAAKKRFLMVTTVACVVATALLGLTGEGNVVLAVFLVVVSFVMFASGENLIASFLPEIVPARGMGRLSGYGWGVGYLGGVLTLAICLGYVSFAEAQGHAVTQYVPVTLLITAAVFVLAASPTFLWLKERAVPTPADARRVSDLVAGFRQVGATFREARRFRDLFAFLTALVVIQAGVSTVIVVAAIYAQEVLGFDTPALVRMVIVVNLTAAVGAILAGHLQDRFGSRPAMVGALCVWIVATVLVLVAQSDMHIWIAANLIGLAMGAGQSVGRALVGRLTPVPRTAAFFGLWGLANRLAAILGPLSYGVISAASGGNHRLAVVSTLVYFVLGLALLVPVDEARGRLAAADASDR